MTTLSTPPLVGERQTSNHDCGPAALASALEWTGRKDTEPGIVAWMHAHNRDQSRTGPADFAAYCLADGNVPNSWDYGNVPMSQYIPAALARGHAVLGLHQCRGTAEPAPRGSTQIAHWRVFYGDDNGMYRTMNPWEPELEMLAQSIFAAADLRCHFELMLPATHPLPPPKPPAPKPGELMKATFFQGPDSTIWLFVPPGAFIPLSEMSVVTAIAADWTISGTPIPLNAADVAAWRAAYPPKP